MMGKRKKERTVPKTKLSFFLHYRLIHRIEHGSILDYLSYPHLPRNVERKGNRERDMEFESGDRMCGQMYEYISLVINFKGKKNVLLSCLGSNRCFRHFILLQLPFNTQVILFIINVPALECIVLSFLGTSQNHHPWKSWCDLLPKNVHNLPLAHGFISME